ALEAIAVASAAELLSKPRELVSDVAAATTETWAALPGLCPGRESPTGKMLAEPSPKPLKKVPIGTRSSSISTVGLRFRTSGVRFLSLIGRARRAATSQRHTRKVDKNNMGTLRR